MPTTKKVPVSKAALLKRLNRRLAQTNEMVRKTRDGTRARFDLGEYFILDTDSGGARYMNIDLEAVGREYEVLQPYEELRYED